MGIKDFIELQIKLDKEAGKKATFYKDEKGRQIIYVHLSNLNKGGKDNEKRN